MKNDGGPAFPVTIEPEPDVFKLMPGMSLRDYMATKAMSGILAGVNSRLPGGADESMVAKDAYAVADAMLAARGQA